SRAHAMPDERTLGLSERGAALGKLDGRVEASASVEIAVGASCVVPAPRRPLKVGQESQVVAVLVEPLAQPGPLPQQCLVCDLDVVVVGNDEARVDQRIENSIDHDAAGTRGDQFSATCSTSCGLDTITDGGEAHQQHAGDALLVVG